MEEVKTDSLSRSAMYYGAIIGVILVAFTFVVYILDVTQSTYVSVAQWLIIIVCIYLAIKRYRDESLNGFIDYGKALGFGSLTFFFASLILGFFTYILYAYIDPALIDKILQAQEEAMLKQNLSDEEIDVALEYIRKFTTPLLMTISTILVMSFTGLLFTLIIAIFVKKKNDSFESNFQ